jgi:uncharacterized Rmd1/YagE family protein
MRCASYCTAEDYNIDELAKYLRKEGLDPKFYDNVIHIHKIRESNEEAEFDAEIYIFPYGCLSLWGLSEEEEIAFINDIKNYEINSLTDHTVDTSTYDYGDATRIDEEDDAIVLESTDDLIKLSLSHGLTQSVKLEAFEFKISQTIEKTRNLPEELASLGKISLSRKKLSQKIGALFAERNSINLHCDILDTPEFFWRRPRYETFYRMAAEYMDLSQRLDILNRRLGVIHELYDILSNELKHAHSSRLEWIIILLIVSEVAMQIFKYEKVANFLNLIGSFLSF